MVDISSVRLGIVGLGNIGHHHAERFVEQGANLVGGVDIAEGARASFRDEFGVPTYEDHHELYEQADAVAVRSEEHTSELQSRIRTSYAVFCLKKKSPDAR